MEFSGPEEERECFTLILSQITWCDELQCRDSRDRICSSLAVSSDATELEVVPVYSKAASYLFLRTSAYAMRLFKAHKY